MAENMKKYIDEQPAVWKYILDNRKDLVEDVLLGSLGLKNRRITKIMLIGSGSSMNASIVSKAFFEEMLGIETDVLMPTRIGRCFHAPKETLVLLVSQSGKSTSTLDAARHMKSLGYEILGMSADKGSALADICEAHILIGCGEESVGPKTKGMTSTILTLYLTALCLAKLWGKKSGTDLNNIIKKLEDAVETAGWNIEKSYEFCRKHVKKIASYPHFTWISDGVGYGISLESALKVLETLYVPAFAYEFEEYLHGVNNTIEKDECYFWLPSTKDNRERMVKLHEFCKGKGCDGYFITTEEIQPPQDKVLKLCGTGEWYTQPFETMIFAQVLSAAGSEEKAIDCDKPKFPDFYQLMNTKLQVR